MNPSNPIPKLLLLAIFVVALVPRLIDLDYTRNLDSFHWVSRSQSYVLALAKGDLAGTLQSSHPGATLMPLAGTSMSVYIGWKLFQDGKSFKNLLDENLSYVEFNRRFPNAFLFAKIPIAVVTALLIVGIYAVLARLTSPLVATGPGFFLCVDPFLLGLSRALHLDAMSSLFAILSILLVVYATDNRCTSPKKVILLGGVFAGFALLTRSITLFAIVFAGLICAGRLLIEIVGEAESWKKHIIKYTTAYACFLVTAGAIFFIAFPAMWIEPLAVLNKVFLGPLGLLDSTSDLVTEVDKQIYFQGDTHLRPNWSFYPLVILYRSTPEMLVLAALAIFRLLYEWRSSAPTIQARRILVSALLLYAVTFTVAMSIFSWKHDRYLLAAFLALDIVAGIELCLLVQGCYDFIAKQPPFFQLLSKALGIALLVFVPSVRLAAIHPNYLTYRDELLFSAEQARHTFQIGWGEGLHEAADYLNNKPNAEALTVGCRTDRHFAPFFRGKTVDILDVDRDAELDYLVIPEHNFQTRKNSAITDPLADISKAEKVITLNGVPYVRIYRVERGNSN